MKLFLDTNIVIDFIGNREPILRRLKYPLPDIYAALIGIRQLVTITGIGSRAIDDCLQACWADFEDYAQYSSAKNAGADRIITRNKKDFPDTDVPVLTPTEFLAEIDVSL